MPAEGQSRRRFFLLIGKAGAAAAATETLAGGLSAFAAVSGSALAALPLTAVPESQDPVIALAQRLAEAHEAQCATCDAVTPFERAMIEWEKANPAPSSRLVEVAELEPDGRGVFNFYRRDRGEGPNIIGGKPELMEGLVRVTDRSEQDALHTEDEEAFREWKRRQQAAKRRMGYREPDLAQTKASRGVGAIERELVEATPRTFQGLVAKAKILSVTTKGTEQTELGAALLRDIAIVSGEAA
jgi:hypothetical protein